jgi:hypothetical protein
LHFENVSAVSEDSEDTSKEENSEEILNLKSEGQMKKLLKDKNKFLTSFDDTLRSFDKTVEIMNI